jgi:hypothetical protein
MAVSRFGVKIIYRLRRMKPLHSGMSTFSSLWLKLDSVGYGLQPVHEPCMISGALGPEGEHGVCTFTAGCEHCGRVNLLAHPRVQQLQPAPVLQ